ncbi:transporter substrate-binding domain-containing protein [Permianibacter sp. IMCC34836]|uniref:substrate-binding periplasmic protein n=1 Tax=Permianibacter fluminis TaxID=2738515 RepID=UPI0015535B98|nr:transporter substrate-binding domain-containing protein [Permianibacter fluminis]NQD36158.1 transporter substrate-binding domain-containing protein [Permianibacter fluminis]
MKRFRMLWLALLAGLPILATAADVPARLQVCGDEDEWPPYTFYQRQNGERSTVVTGYNIDLLNLLLGRSGRSAEYRLLPWKRCLSEAAGGHYDLVLDGVKVSEREKLFRFPSSHYSTHVGYLYNRDRPVPSLPTAAHLRQYRACGQFGYAYDLNDNQPLPALNTEAKSYPAVIRMLEQGNCDLVPINLELVQGYRLIGLYDAFSSGRIAVMPAPSWAHSEVSFYFMVSRAPDYSDALQTLLSKTIAEAARDGSSARLGLQYLPKIELPKIELPKSDSPKNDQAKSDPAKNRSKP